MGRAAVFNGPDRPLELAGYPTPEPRAGEVLVRVACCTLCRSDLHTHAGRRAEPLPAVLGHEIVGTIAAFGPGTAQTDFRGTPAAAGTRVTWAVAVGCGGCFFCADGLPQKCETPFKYGHRRADPGRPAGGLSGYVVLVPGTDWLVVPDEIPDRVAAPANCATATAAGILRAAGPVEGRSVLVLGAGVLGVTACAMARAAGARVVLAADPLPANRDRAGRFGATHTAPTGAGLTAVAGLTAGRGADVVLELAGTADAVAAALALARVGGTVVLAGTVAPVGTVPLDPEAVVRRMLTVRGVHNYHPRDLAAAIDFLAGPGLEYPFAELVGSVYALGEADQAFADAHARPGVRVAVVP
ncbi:MAG TPA: zinc-binding dehydrogenase [Urbifossiella sp.]|jgi:alcohol dehydrogenase|nr:zinc-binding dehydrogenase [Urbifossiella sp.]